MKTITFYSYKGGLGRSLVVANFARYLARFGLTVAVMDLDLEAPGLHHKFSTDRSKPVPGIKSGIIDYLHDFRGQGNITSPLSDFYVPIESAGSQGKTWLFPAGNAGSPEYWERLTSLDWHSFFLQESHSGVDAFDNLKRCIEEELHPDYLLIDSRTGITEVGGIATNLLPDAVVCFMLDNEENLEGMRIVLQSLARRHEVFGGEPLTIVPVVSRFVADPESEAKDESKRLSLVESEIAQCLKNSPQGESGVLVIHQDNDLHRHEFLAIESDHHKDGSLLMRDYLKLFQRLVPPQSIEHYLPQLIDRAKQEMFNDADSAVKELEHLADYTESPLALRELIAVFEIRRESSERLLSIAARLWRAGSPPTDPIHWEIVQKHFRSYWTDYMSQHRHSMHYRQARWGQPADNIDNSVVKYLDQVGNIYREFFPSDIVDYVEAIWFAREPADEELGLLLLSAFQPLGISERLFEVARRLHDFHPVNPQITTRVMKIFRLADNFDEALKVFERISQTNNIEPNILGERLKLAVRMGGRLKPLEDIEGFDLNTAMMAAPSSAVRLLLNADRKTEALHLAADYIMNIENPHKGSDYRQELADLFIMLDSEEMQFSLGQLLAGRLSNSQIDRLYMLLKREGIDCHNLDNFIYTVNENKHLDDDSSD